MKALLLFDNTSINNGHSDPKHLLDLLHKVGKNDYEVASYDELVYSLTTDTASITIGISGPDISEYDVIYFRRYQADVARAKAAAEYANERGVAIVDKEILSQEGSSSKLSQYMMMALQGIGIPSTLHANSVNLIKLIKQNKLPLAYPIVIKSSKGTRGSENELIHSDGDAIRLILKNEDKELLLQEFIPNSGDYRVWVVGTEVGPVYYRQRNPASSHKNNTSLGAGISQVTDQSVVDHVSLIAIKAATIFDRSIAGVDIVFYNDDADDMRVFEVNRSPQIEGTLYEEEKAKALDDYLKDVDKKHQTSKSLDARKKKSSSVSTIGVSTYVDFAGYKNLKKIPARIDSGARTSSLWASDIKIKKDIVTFKLFGKGSPWFTGKVVKKKLVGYREVTSSTGHIQNRIVISMSVRVHGKRLNAKFTLSDRSTQTYPILIGRNTLRGNFLVDSGDPGEAKLYKYPEEAFEFYESEEI